MNIDEARKKLTDLKVNPDLTVGLLDAADQAEILRGSTDEIADGIKAAGKEVNTFGTKTKNVFSGLGTSLLNFIKSPAGIVTALTAAFAGFVTYMNYAGHSFTRLQDDFETKSDQYQSTKSEVESLNSELQTTQNRIAELNKLSSQDGGLSIVEQSELDTLTQTNEQLERQLEIKESLLKIQEQSAASAAIKASGNELSDTEYIENETGMSGWVYNLLKWTGKLSGVATPFSSLSDSFDELDTTTEGMLATSIQRSKELQTELSSLQSDYIDAIESGDEKKASSIQKEIDKTSKTYESATTNIGKYTDTISGWIDACTDDYGKIQYGSEEQVRSWKDAITQVQNMGKTQSQILDNNLKSYFDGSDKSYIIKQLKAMAEEGTLTAESVSKLGLNLSDAGIEAQNVADYFNQMASAAKTATDESKGLSNGLTISDVEDAFESENAGDGYVKLHDLIEQAKEIEKQGLIGTDDFKSIGEFLSYEKSDGNVEAFARDVEKIKRYFTEDNDGNLTGAGINNFLTDLQNLNKGYAEWDQNTQRWNFNMDNTALAAKELGISVQSMEAILGRIKDYDGVGDFDFHSALEDFSKAEEALNGLQEIYDSMNASNKKDAFGKELDNWKSQLDGYENDLASLDDEFVVHMKLEYDLASIQQDIDKMNSVINEKGERNATADQLAERNSAQTIWLENAEEQLGFNNENVQLPIQITNIDSETQKIRDSLSKLSGQDLIDAQIQISNLQEVKQDLIKTFMDEHPEVNIESNTDEINNAWNSFIDSAKGKEIIAKITADTNDAESKIDAIRQEEVEDKIVKLVGQDDATYIMFMWNELQADPKFTALSASDQATYLIGLWDSFTPEQKQAVMTTMMEATDNASTTVEGVDSKVNSMRLDPNVNIGASDNASGIIGSVSTSLAGLNGTTAHTYIVTHKSEVGGGKLLGTAHNKGTAGLYPIPKLSGRALAMGSLSDPSWLKPNWKTKKDETALTGEMGQELVVQGNRWWTVGDNGAEFSHIPQGSIVFDTNQTKELFKKGYTNSRGIAHLSGTAYAGGASGGFSFGGGASVYNPPYSGSYTPNPAPVQQVADAAEDFSEEVDHIQTKLERLERKIKNIERISSSAFENFTTRNNALKDQISAVTDEINVQKQGYDRYMQQANSVSLSEDYKNKIRNGSIDIETITDKDLSENIKSYQEW